MKNEQIKKNPKLTLSKSTIKTLAVRTSVRTGAPSFGDFCSASRSPGTHCTCVI